MTNVTVLFKTQFGRANFTARTKRRPRACGYTMRDPVISTPPTGRLPAAARHADLALSRRELAGEVGIKIEVVKADPR